MSQKIKNIVSYIAIVYKGPGFYIPFFFILFLLALSVRLAGDINLASNLPVDYRNYLRGMQELYLGNNPYGKIEFFAPPWIAFLLSPFYLLKLPVYWQFFCTVFVIALLFITYKNNQVEISAKNILLPSFLFLLPTTLFSIILGQLSPLIGLSIALLYTRYTQKKNNPWETSFVIVFLTLKAHIVFLPLLFLGFELIKEKKWKTISITILSVLTLAFLSSLVFYKNWLPALLEAIFIGKKYLGGDGLAASFYTNFASIGISPVLFIPHLVYFIYLWLKKGITQYLFLLLLTANFLIIPYSRQYDFVILLPVYFYLLLTLFNTRRYVFAIILSLLIYVLPFFTALSFTIPAILLILLLIFPPKTVEGI